MKKEILMLAVVVLSFTLFSCGNTNGKSSSEKKATIQPITMDNIIGEWECVDITNGVTHMESIAKMQPHIVFNEKSEIFSKMKLPDGSFVNQKVGSFKIENGKVTSGFFEDKLYMQGDKLIMESSSGDDKRIYKKII